MDEKKKLMILGALAVAAIVVVVIFVMPHGSKAPEQPVASSQPPDNSKATLVAQNNPTPGVVPNPGLGSLPERDPFEIPVKPVVPTPSGGAPIIHPPKGSGLKGTLPAATSDGKKGGDTAPPKPVVAPPPPFPYTVAGVVIGRKPAVVIRDASGTERLITEGSPVDADTTVLNVSSEEVSFLYFKKELHVKVGGESVANK